ncbi:MULTISPECIES: signal peptidase I [unclassified Campylobacter]|uniref:signal peptidase I n=1 Tax=unclassified Campylobacter TaxID=2593542 RepID=UPI001237B808|nr:MULTISPECIES: signal peptidase I [unclassified Campylobacter]KAA6225339.1 signal peptidase I [Campylobacter sp. LR185c]KAA6227035.1 signal peptidase I [Campylobacter sp. LR196d]KAA6227606.1 signal peptidase I [Campylobacter sp. LR286c]KAA6229471.1 signal peptidase I [Campylobacter sp. LR264d]KAA6230716.1 signal peptidase I [Campylobacter sp. LR291e]
MSRLKKLYNFSNSWTGTIIIVLLVIFFFIQAFVIPSGSMKNTLLVKDFLFVKKFSYGIVTPHIPWFEFPLLPDFFNNGHLIEGPRPQRGDMVVFRNPQDKSIHFVKRCVGVGGDRIIYADKTLYVRMSEGDSYMKEHYPGDLVSLKNELFVKEPFKQKGINYDDRVDIDDIIFKFINVGAFAMKAVDIEGLNRAYEFEVPNDEYFMMGDNRDHSNDSRFWGAVPYSLIVGKPWFVYLSLDDDFSVRWDRIGRFVDTLENNEKYIKEQIQNEKDFS